MAKEYAAVDEMLSQCVTDGNEEARTCTVSIPHTRNQSQRLLVKIDKDNNGNPDAYNQSITVDIHCNCPLQVLPFALVTVIVVIALCLSLSLFLGSCIRRPCTQQKLGPVLDHDSTMQCGNRNESGSLLSARSNHCSHDGCPGTNVAYTRFSDSEAQTSVEPGRLRQVRNYSSCSSGAASVANVSVVIESGGEISRVIVQTETIHPVAEQNTVPIIGDDSVAPLPHK